MAANGSMRRRTVDAPGKAIVPMLSKSCMANPYAASLHPRTSSHSTQTPEPSPIDSMPAQLASDMPSISTSKPNGAPALLRKQSSPMMPPFMVSAPGKVIVYGEHAVVHGKVGSIGQPGRDMC